MEEKGTSKHSAKAKRVKNAAKRLLVALEGGTTEDISDCKEQLSSLVGFPKWATAQERYIARLNAAIKGCGLEDVIDAWLSVPDEPVAGDLDSSPRQGNEGAT